MAYFSTFGNLFSAAQILISEAQSLVSDAWVLASHSQDTQDIVSDAQVFSF